jgi:transcriptional regulator with XRE-family HTH domain
MTLGTLLIKWRQQHRKKQKEVAAALEVGQSTYCDWEGDHCLPQTKQILSLARVLGVNAEVILQCIHGEELVKDAEIQRLQEENKQLRQRDLENQQTIHVLMNTIKKFPSANPPHINPNSIDEGRGNMLNFNSLKKG